MLEEFAEVAGASSFHEPKIPIVSNLTGEPLSAEQATDPAYWVRHVREPVRFADAVATLHKQGASTYLELGPDPVLCAMARESLAEEAQDEGRLRPHPARGTARGGRGLDRDRRRPRAGAKLDWEAFFKGTGAKRVPLPTYPFQRKRYWLSAGASAAGRRLRSDRPRPITRCSERRSSSPTPKATACCSPVASPWPPTPGWRTTPSAKPSSSPEPPSSSWRCERASSSGPRPSRS